MRRLSAGLVATGAMVATMLGASTASAAPAPQGPDGGPVQAKNGGGQARTWMAGSSADSNLEACDRRANGWGIRGYLYRPTPGKPSDGRVLLSVSDGSYNGWNACKVVAKVMPDHDLNLKVCEYRGARLRYCEWAVIRS